MATVDIAKGIAISAIVLGHVLRGLREPGILEATGVPFLTVDTLLYSFHLAVFAFTAGVFVSGSVARRGVSNFLRVRLAEILWLYVVWTLLQGASKLVLSSVVNNPIEPLSILRLWVPIEQFWFFGWLAVVLIAAALVQPWKSAKRAAVSTCVVVAVSALDWFSLLNVGLFGLQGHKITVYFWLALISGKKILEFISQRSSAQNLVAAVLLFLMGSSSALWLSMQPELVTEELSPLMVAVNILGSIFSTLAVLLLSNLLASTGRVAEFFRYLGRNSLSIFVAHVFFMSGLRVVMLKLGLDSLSLHIILGTVAGVVGPVVLQYLGKRFRFPYLFAAPKWLTNSEKTASQIAASAR